MKTSEGEKPTCSPSVAKIIASLGEGIDPVTFLKPKLQDLPDLAGQENLARGGEILAQAISRGDGIAIFGDYDADGVTACVLMVEFIESCGGRALHYLPNRLKEGYGLNITAIEKMAADFSAKGKGPGEKLLITVDCGISSVSEIEYAKSLGFVVMVTDHHQAEKAPPADCVINPNMGENPGFKGLSGVGVAFFLAAAARVSLRQMGFFAKERREPDIRELLDLVALGTVADMVPLTGTNRILARAGIERMNNAPRAGIKCLIDGSGLVCGYLGGRDISFRLAPKINAAGRLGRTGVAFDLLREKNESAVRGLAQSLEQLNQQRREITDQAIQSLELCTKKQDDTHKTLLVFKGEGVHLGVTGLAAARLMRKHQLPVIVISVGKGVAIGSGRAPEGYDLYEALEQCADLFVSFGGHRQACGVTIPEVNIDEFIQRTGEIRPKLIVEESRSDARLAISGHELFADSFLNDFADLEPFGTGNPEPLLVTDEPLIPDDVTRVGEKSLRFSLKARNKQLPAIFFGKADTLEELTSQPHHIIFQLSRNHFRGRATWQAVVKGFQTELS